MNPAEYDILQLIPQRQPVVMIEKLTYADDKSAKGRLFVKESNVFCHNAYFQEAGLIECIAQTAAAYTGYLRMLSNEKIKPGYIGAIKNLVIHSLPVINSEIHSEIVVENEILGCVIITGKIIQNDSILAECEMRIFLYESVPSMT